MKRIAKVARKTKETDINVEINIDGTGKSNLDTGIGFLDHMLEQISRHGLFDLIIKAKGDLHIDAHHTVEDIGITLEDIKFVKKYSDYVFDNVDPGPYTAKGLFYSIEQAVNIYFSEDLQNKKIAIQGAGSVGKKLAEHLANSGAQVYISDIDRSKLDSIENNNITPIDDALSFECDLFSPCAVGAIFTKSSINNLKCKIIAGGANNQLLDASIAKDLHDIGIVFIPDILINSGGVIGLTKDLLHRDEAQTEMALKDIAKRVKGLMISSKENSISILEALNKQTL